MGRYRTSNRSAVNARGDLNEPASLSTLAGLPEHTSMEPMTHSTYYPEGLSLELSARRTGLSFQRARMSADRTLMSAMRTSLTLIVFGFTLFQLFEVLPQARALESAGAAPRFGVALVLLGIATQVGGILHQLAFLRGLRLEREELRSAGLIYAYGDLPLSPTLIVAVLLVAIGILAIASMVFDVGPFG